MLKIHEQGCRKKIEKDLIIINMKINQPMLLIHEQGCRKEKDLILISLKSINECSKFTRKCVEKTGN